MKMMHRSIEKSCSVQFAYKNQKYRNPAKLIGAKTSSFYERMEIEHAEFAIKS